MRRHAYLNGPTGTDIDLNDAVFDMIPDIPKGSFNQYEIGHGFEIYEALEPSKSTEVGDWGGRTEATAEIAAARERHTDAT